MKKIYIISSLRFILPVLVMVGLSAEGVLADVCWKNTYGRGAGIVPGNCSPGQEKSGLLCYPKCQDGYTGVAFVCWQQCPSGWRDDGAFCAKPSSYGRGAGYVIWDEGKCNRENSQGCEKSGALWYPKCAPGFHAVGCCVCSPDCPQGMTDIGVSCAKKSYTRATITPNCGSQDYNAGLCYKKCDKNYSGVGPVCWGNCPAGWTDCGAMCGQSAGDCADAIVGQIVSVGKLIATVASMVVTAGGSTGATVAANAAEQSAATAIKEVAKKLGKEMLKRFGKLALNELKAKIVPELQKMNMPSAMADKLAEMAAEPDKVNYMDVLKAVDPVGITGVVEAFKKSICDVNQAAPGAVDEISMELSKPETAANSIGQDSLSSSGPAISSDQPNSCIMSQNAMYRLCMQGDGNLVIYEQDAKPVWGSNTNGKGRGPYKLAMQDDGNLVIYDADGNATWASNTNGKGQAPFKLVMQNDRNAVIYDKNNQPIWDTKTMK